jgi:thiamine pyrophosphokinase
LRAIIVADGDLDPADLGSALSGVDRTSCLVIGADGGSRRIVAAGIRPDLVVGDADSLEAAELERLRARGVPLEVVDAAKDESDTELSVRSALSRGAKRLTILGALGGRRPEHMVANLLLLAHPMLDDVDVAIVHDGTTIRRTGTLTGPGHLELAGPPGDHVSLLPIDTVEGVTTAGLRFPLRDEPLVPGPARGLSNELLEGTARVATRRGRLLVIHTSRKEVSP